MSPPTSPLKILHVISGDLWAGAEVQAFTLISTLHRSGVTVQAALLNDGELARRLRSSGIPVTIFDEAQLDALSILAALRRLMLQWQPDVVHTHRTKENVLGSLANRLAHNAPSVRTAHGAPEHAARGLRQLHKRLFVQLDRWCGTYLQQRVIAVSKDLSEKLAKEFPENKLIVIENGVDVDAVRAQAQPVEFRTNAPAATHIGIVGRLVQVKRVDLFLEISAQLRHAHPERDWRFHIFGDGPLRARLENQSQQLAIRDIATFHGHRSDIIACIRGLDALVMCSDHEGLPMTALEALAVGTPIVAHAVGGLVDVLQHNPLGCLVDCQNALSYANAAWKLLEEESAPARSARVATRFLASHNADRIRLLYREMTVKPNSDKL